MYGLKENDMDINQKIIIKVDKLISIGIAPSLMLIGVNETRDLKLWAQTTGAEERLGPKWLVAYFDVSNVMHIYGHKVDIVRVNQDDYLEIYGNKRY